MADHCPRCGSTAHGYMRGPCAVWGKWHDWHRETTTMHEYHTQRCGDTWFSEDGEEAEEIRLWDGDTVLAVVAYDDHGDTHARGTYTITEHDIRPGRFSADDLTGWRDWRSALEFASGTERKEWDNS